MKEEWKRIPGHPRYEISNFGRVKSHRYYHGNTLGYLSVRLVNNPKNKKRRLIHQLVWESFGNKKYDGQHFVIDHIDENKENNRIDNLRLLSNSRNVARGHRRNLPTGVTLTAQGTYLATINFKHMGKQKYLGRYKTPEEASKVYQKALKEAEAENETTYNRRLASKTNDSKP
jgi:hypothetical protein